MSTPPTPIAQAARLMHTARLDELFEAHAEGLRRARAGRAARHRDRGKDAEPAPRRPGKNTRTVR